MSTWKCNLCGAVINIDPEFEEDYDEILWGHIQMAHEQKFAEIQNWETPFMLEECYSRGLISTVDKAEFLGQIIDVFEDFLEERGIVLPNEERDQDPDNAAIIYGTDYGQLQDELAGMMVGWGLMVDG